MALQLNIQTSADLIQSASGNFSGSFPSGTLTTSPRGYTWAADTDQGLIDMDQLGITETMKLARVQIYMAGQTNWTLSLVDGSNSSTLASGTNETSYSSDALGMLTPGQKLKLVTSGAGTTSVRLVVTLANIRNVFVQTSTAAGGSGSVTNVTGTSPISVANGTTTPVVSMTAADATHAGYITTSAQVVAGAKTFNNTVISGVSSGTDAFQMRSGAHLSLDGGTDAQYISSDGTNLNILGLGLSIPSGNSILLDGAAGSATLNYDGVAHRILSSKSMGIPDGTTFQFGTSAGNNIGYDGFKISVSGRFGTQTTPIYVDNGDGSPVAFMSSAGHVGLGTNAWTSIASGVGVPNDPFGNVFNNSTACRSVLKCNIGHGLWTAASTTQTIALGVSPAKTNIISVIADTDVVYAGLAGTIQLKIGLTSGGNELILAHDVKTATVTKGLLAADVGASMSVVGNNQVGVGYVWGAGQTIYVTLTSGTGNLGNGTVTNLTTGDTVFYIVTETMA